MESIQISKHSLLAIIELAREAGLIDAGALAAACDHEALEHFQADAEHSRYQIQQQLLALGFIPQELATKCLLSSQSVTARHNLLSLLIRTSLPEEYSLATIN